MYLNRGRGRARGRRNNSTQDGSSVLNNVEQQDSKCINAKVTEQLNLITINLILDEATDTWLTQLKNSWNYLKKSPSIVNMITQRFEGCSNPYEEALLLMYNCTDFKYAKPKSLSFLIMDEFKTWSTSARNKIIHLLTSDIKISAFNIVRKQNLFSLMKLVAEAYEMSMNCDIFLDIIKGMIQDKKYKEACQSTALLGLHEKFGIDEFLVPLILQDKIVVVEEFLSESPEHQVNLIGFLDSLLGRSSTIRMTLDAFIAKHDIPEIKWDKLFYKPFRKLITRLKKVYNLSDEVTPFLIKKQNEGALQFLIHRRYIENAIGDESFKEMVHEAIQGDAILQQELVLQVSYHGDTAGALTFAINYNIPKENWPYNVRLLFENPDQNRRQQQSSIVDTTWDVELTTNIEYYKLKIPIHNIFLIDCESSFENFLDVGLNSVDLVGIDCEWKPSFGTQKSELALIQIATRNEVYILDVIQMGSELNHLWEKFGKTCFNNCDILKLGFGLTSDMSMIRHSLPQVNINQKIGFLDLLSLWKHIEKTGNLKFPYEVQSGGPSLSTLVHLCLGLPLNKADQFSNWEKRPLRTSQLEYAALDAFCLIEVYDVLRKCCENMQYPFDDTCFSIMSNLRVHQKKSKKHLHKKKSETIEVKQPPSPHLTTVQPTDVKFICDNMVQGLGKQLRKCGIDTVILDNNEDHMECVRLFQNDNRYIITKGNIFNKLNGNVTPGSCYKVISDDCQEQLKEVLEYYKIVVTMDYVFSRCQVCNSNSFIKISKSTMCTLHESYKKTKLMNIPPPPCYDDDYDDDGCSYEASGFSSDEDYDESRIPVQHYKKWELYCDEQIDVGLCKTKMGAKIQVESIPPEMLNKIDLFYVCETCGKVYWDGSHLNKTLTGKLQGIVQN